MTDIVERLRMQEIADCDEAADEIEQLNAARVLDGHRMLKMSDDYEADQAEIERLRKRIDQLIEISAVEMSKRDDEIERLRTECEAWRECARYDPKMEGPAFKGWDRSALDRCRKRYIEEASHGR